MLLGLVETIIVPSVTTLMVPGVTRAVEAKQLGALAALVLLFIVLMDLPRAYRRVIATWFPEPRYGDRLLFLQFPPRQRADMLPMDLAMAALLGYLLYSHYQFGWHW